MGASCSGAAYQGETNKTGLLGPLCLGEPPVGDFCDPFRGKQDIPRLDIPVDDPLIVGVPETLCNTRNDGSSLFFTEGEMQVCKGCFDIFHLDIGQGENICRIQLDDIFVMEPLPDIEFFCELGSGHLVESYRDFHRDIAVVLLVPCPEIPGKHPLPRYIPHPGIFSQVYRKADSILMSGQSR